MKHPRIPSRFLVLVLSSLVMSILLAPSAFARTGHTGMAFAHHSLQGNPLEHLFAHPDFILKTKHGTQAPNIAGFSPKQLMKAYAMFSGSNDGTGITIAIVDACGNPNAQADLDAYDSTFVLPYTTISVVTPEGTPCSDPSGWGVETELDLQMVHTFAPGANIVLEEAASNSYSDLLTAVQDAYTNQGATVVSMSFGGSEFSGETGSSADGIFSTGNTSYGVSFTASSGDSGCGAQYPAASPFVTSIGGTSLYTRPNGVYSRESAWNGSGGGLSAYEARPAYQNGFNPNGARGIPDVAMVADPNTGVAIYDSDYYGFIELGGTSVAAPLWAGVLARANSGRYNTMQNADNELYSVASNAAKYKFDYHDIKTGSSGGVCNAGAGYDLVTGLGSAVGLKLIPDLISAP